MGIIYVFNWIDPLRGDEDKEAVEKAMYEINYMFLDAIVWGKSILRRSGAPLSISIDRGDLKGKIDWLGLNYYTRGVVTADEKLGYRFVPEFGKLCTPKGTSKAGRPVSDIGWEVYPEGLYHLLKTLYGRYRLPIIVSENGVADETDSLRPRFIVSHLTMLHRALREGIDIRGYLVWALTDNYEWAKGFSMRFGLAFVNYKTKKRYLRPSALVFREIVKARAVPEELLELTKI